VIDQLDAMIYVYDLMKSAEPSTPMVFLVLDHESINREFRGFAVEQGLEKQILSSFFFAFPDYWHMTMNMNLAIVIGGSAEKPNNPWWVRLVRPFLRRAVFPGEKNKNLSRKHVRKDMDFNEVYDFVMVLVIAYHELRRDGLVVIDENKYRENPDLAAVRDLFEEHALVPILLLSTHKTGGDLPRIRARAVRSLIALHCTNYTNDMLQFLLNYEKLKAEAPFLTAMFDENANDQNQGFIERMHALLER
jgi:hypothetical protein